MSGDIFTDGVVVVVVPTGIWWLETRDACQHPTAYKIAPPPQGRLLSPKHLQLRLREPNLHHLSGLPGGASGKATTCQCRRHKRHRFDPWVGQILSRRAWRPKLQYSCLENPMDRGSWWATVRRIGQNRT